MKTINIIFLVLFTYFFGLAQNPELTDNDWHLQNVIIDGQDNIPPINEEVTSIDVFFNAIANGDSIDWFETNACNNLSGFVIYNTTSPFFTFNGPLEVTLIVCNQQINEDYENFYFGYYYDNLTDPFEYLITTNPDNSKVLTITAVSGDQAIYSNVLLSNQGFEKNSFSLYPNPVQNILYIQEQITIEISSVKVYDLMGRIVLTKESNLNQIDVSHLTSGLFFVNIETDKGTITKKIIKE